MRCPTFPSDAVRTLPDRELGVLLLNHFVETQAYDLGMSADAIDETFVDRVRQHLLSSEAERVENAGLEKALHRAARGDLERAGKIFRDHMNVSSFNMAAFDEALTGLRRQRSAARNSRPDRLQRLILDIMDSNPRMSTAEVMRHLEEQKRGEVIDDIDEGIIHFTNRHGDGGPMAAISGLKDRVSRARKALSSPTHDRSDS